MTTFRILILGGTTEARALAAVLSNEPRLDLLLSLAGRTQQPAVQPVNVRTGGFGGVQGLVEFLRNRKFHLLIDATHPFAGHMAANAKEAAALAGVAAFKLTRPAWLPEPGVSWTCVDTVQAAIDALGAAPRRVFLTVGRQEAHQVLKAPQHYYLMRSVDPVDPPLDLPRLDCILARGPFDLDNEMALLRVHAIDVIIAKNSGGSATYAKLEAAARLGVEIVMVTRPVTPHLEAVETVDAAVSRVRELAAAAFG